MRWTVELRARKRDLERLTAESLPGVDVSGARGLLSFDFADSFEDPAFEDESHAAKAVVDAFVQRVNGFGKLRWGRAFEGISTSAIRSIDATGKESQYVFLGTAHWLTERLR